jgi:hypothetical protein
VKVVRAPREQAARIDVGSDRRGEFFELSLAGGRGISLDVVEADRDERCLLLLVRKDGEKSKFLCGSHERHWFVAAIPESASGVRGIVSAKVALQPEAMREAVARVRPKDRFRRRNVAYVRQGEWFFLPDWALVVNERDVLRDEPLTRGRGKDAHARPRQGPPARVRLPPRRRDGLRQHRASRRDRHDRVRAALAVAAAARRLAGDGARPELYAKGSVRHPDHNTIVLPYWHRVLMNTEQRARAMRHVAFLD